MMNRVNLVLLAALAVAACGGGQQQQQQPNAPVAPAQQEPYGSAMGQPGGVGNPEPAQPGGSMSQQYKGSPGAASTSEMGQYGPPPTIGNAPPPAPAPAQPGATSPMGTMDVSNMDDAQLAAIMQAIHMGEIEQAQLAETKATMREVKDFAREMLRGHRDMQIHDSALLQRLNVTPTENDVSKQLEADVQNQMSMLQSMRGRDFDRGYVDAMVRGHDKALELVDRMIPIVKNSELKAELQGARSKIEAHLRDAEGVQQSIQRGSASPQR